MWQSFKNVYHLAMAVLANVFFGFPSKKLVVVGVTGTDGKTTTVNLIYHILKSAGKNVSIISSVGAVINNKNFELGFHVTTPSSWKLQRFLQKVARGPVALAGPADSLPPPDVLGRQSSLRALGGGPPLASPATGTTPRYLVLEVTSHALDQQRVWGIPFTVGVLTNVTHEHLDYHKTYENYVKTKAKLLQMAKISIVNADDESYKIISKLPTSPGEAGLRGTSKTQNLITYGLKSNSDVNPENFPFKTRLAGEFNQYNILAAVAACRALEVNNNDIRKAITSFKLPVGRMEIIYSGDFTVMIDFAHTPNALAQVLSTVRKNVEGRLIHVFGAAGKRDSSKRSLMGGVSAKYADIIVLTAEDPRSESVDKIISEIKSRIKISNPKSQIPIYKIPDRQEAINTAIKMAKKGDVVIITGKGHEQSMNYGRGEIPWSEHEAVRKTLERRNA